MTLRNLFALFAVGTTLAVSVTASAEAGSTTPNACFAGHRVGPVSAYRRPDQQTAGYTEQLAGAHVFVYAEQGLTAEWLHYSLEQQRAAGSANSECPLNVPGARLSVQTGGPGFWVTLSTDDAAAAKQIFARAKRLEHR